MVHSKNNPMMTPVMIANSLKVVEPRLLPSLSAGLDAGFVGRMVELGSADGVGERDEAVPLTPEMIPALLGGIG